MGRKLLLIERGKYQAKTFINEMKDFTKDVVNGIKNSDRKYKHDNLTTTECPTCGKFMIKVKTKMVRCLCAKIHLVRRKRMYSAKQMQDVQTVKRN